MVRMHNSKLKQKILQLLAENNQNYSLTDIANKLNKPKSNIYRSISSLIKNGLVNKLNLGVVTNYQLTNKGKEGVIIFMTPVTQNDNPLGAYAYQDYSKEVMKFWRLHGLHFVIKPYYFYPKYHKVRAEQGNYSISYSGWSFKFHKGTVQMQLQPHVDFKSVDKWEVFRLAEDSFNRVLRQASHRYGFEVWKDKKCNIRLVNAHLARSPSEVAEVRDGEFLKIKGLDGKVWFTVDKSDGKEHEYLHPERFLDDSEKIEPYFNDLLYNQPPTNSQLMGFVSGIAGNQDMFNQNILKHLDVLDKIGDGMNEFRESLQPILRIVRFFSRKS